MRIPLPSPGLLLYFGAGLLGGCGGCEFPAGGGPIDTDVTATFCFCDCTQPDGGIVQKRIDACLPEDLRGDPSLLQRQGWCDQVAQSFEGMLTILWDRGEYNCECTAPIGGDIRNPICDADCEPNKMPDDAHGQVGDADGFFTHSDDDTPFCVLPTSDPPDPTPEGGASVLGRQTRCFIESSEATIDSSDIDPDENPASVIFGGVIAFTGGPCPDASCDVGIAFDLTFRDFDITTDCLICENANVTDAKVQGASLPGTATLDAAGSGSFPEGSIEISGTAKEDDDRSGFETGSFEPVNVEVGWEGHTCHMDTEFTIPATDDLAAIAITAEADGVISNAPPTADAGSDEVIECTSTDGAEIALDGSGSTDPESNIETHLWIRTSDDSTVGTEPEVLMQQALGVTEAYRLVVGDSHLQISDDETTVSVVDTTAPVIEAIDLEPTCLWSPNHRYIRYDLGGSLRVPVMDVCDASPDVVVANVTSSEADDALGDGSTTDDVLAGPEGFCIRAERSGPGPGRTYTVTIAATDDFGNRSTRDAVVVVPHADDCPRVPRDRLLTNEEAIDACDFSGAGAAAAGVLPPRPHEGTAAGGCSVGGGRAGAAPGAWLPFCLMLALALRLGRGRRPAARGRTVVVGILLIAGAGCGGTSGEAQNEQAPKGSIEVEWEVTAMDRPHGCYDDPEIVSIQAVATDGVAEYRAVTECSPVRQIAIRDMRDGVYTVVVDALTAEGNPVLRASEAGIEVRRGRVARSWMVLDPVPTK